ncbi:MAG: HD domain-containing protein [Candidatus Sumerlaeota bacterium]
MLHYQQALALLESQGLHHHLVRHCKGVSRFADQLARRIAERNPDLGVDPEKVRVAALLHDIGRARPGDHEHNSVEMLREMGHPELADIVLHGVLYESSILEDREDPSLLPETIEQKIVTYSDLRFAQEPLTLRERIEDAVERKKHHPPIAEAIARSIRRFEHLETELMALAGEDALD